MPKFVTKKIGAVKGRLKYEQLVVLPQATNFSKFDVENAKGELDKYEDSLQERDKKSFAKILSYMNLDANLTLLPHQKFKEVTPKGETVKEYEFKHEDLRVYAIKIPNGKLIVLGGYKNAQSKDINRFRSLKHQYLTSLKERR